MKNDQALAAFDAAAAEVGVRNVALLDKLRGAFARRITSAPEHLLQDMDRGLSQWLASKPDARLNAREAAAAIEQAKE